MNFIAKKHKQLMSTIKSIAFNINMLFFYRNLFSLSNTLRMCIVYFFYKVLRSQRAFMPLTVNFLITSACNFNCSICSYSAQKNKAMDSLTLHDVEAFIRSLGKHRPVLFFSGGEPFLRQDFLDILAIAKKYNFKCGVNTNAYFLDARKIERLLALNVELLIFSLFGPQRVHDKITGVSGSYDRACGNIKCLCARKNKNMRVILNCAINPDNIDSLEEVPVIAKMLGADAVKLEHLNFISHAELKDKKRHFVSGPEALNTFISEPGTLKPILSDKIAKKLESIKSKYGSYVFIKPDLKKDEINNWYSDMFNSRRKCFFVRHSIFIRPDGMVVPCQFLQNYELGSIKENGLRDIIGSEKAQGLKKALAGGLLPECSRCCKL